MLRVTHKSDEVAIKFDHKWCSPEEIERITGVHVEDKRRCTMVTVELNENIVGTGLAVCHPGDNFCRHTGRKKAMAYAIYPLSKELRTAVWEEYEIQIGL